MRTLRFLLIAIAALIVVLLCVGNRHIVPVFLGPDFSSYGVGGAPSAQIPLFVVGLGVGGLGFVLGAALEYWRERRFRSVMRARRREIGRLQHEVEALKREHGYDEDDEIIALTSRPGRRRVSAS